MYKYEAGLYNQYEKLLEKSDEQNKNIKNLTDTIKELNVTISQILNENQKLKTEIERLKNQINKNSSNSNKPSSTNGFKKVMNNREKTGSKKGAVKGHKGKTLSPEYIEKLIADGKVDEVRTIEIGKTNVNKFMKPIIKYTYDLEIKKNCD